MNALLSGKGRASLSWGFAAALVLLAATWRSGMRLPPDAAVYVSTAQELVRGKGFVTAVPDSYRFVGDASPQPLIHFPPLYPASLAVATSAFGERLGAWLLAGGLFGVTVALSVEIVRRSAGTLRWPAMLAGTLTILSPQLLDVFSSLQSEALFLPLMLIAVLLAAESRGSGSECQFWGSAIAVGLACSTRYAGLCLVPALVLVAMPPARHRLKGSNMIGRTEWLALAALPSLAWVVRNFWVAGSTTNRSIAVHPPAGDDLLALAATLSSWVVPTRVPAAVGIGAFLAVATAVIWRRRRLAARRAVSPVWMRSSTDSMIVSLFLTAVASIAMVLLARTFLDAAIRFDTRTLAPAYLPILLLCLIAFGTGEPATPQPSASDHGRRPTVERAMLIALAVTFVALTIVRGARWVGDLRRLSPRAGWPNPALSDQAARLPSTVHVYSTSPYIVFFETNRAVSYIPRPMDEYKRTSNPRYAAEIAELKAQVLSGRAAVLWYRSPAKAAWEAALLHDLDLRPTLEMQGGWLLFAPPPVPR